MNTSAQDGRASAPTHVPVMLQEVLAALSPKDGESYIDGTFGGGGYTRAMLDAAGCRVTGIDRDPDAIARGRALAAASGGRLTLVQGEFSRMHELCGPSDGVVLDLGVSSFQFDEADRGFSFRHDGPLDMRMSREGISAADVVNGADERTLMNIISRLGEERNARRIARAIIAARPVTGTAELARIVCDAQGPAAQQYAIHPATRTFQALRIHVNDELGELERGLEAAQAVLKVHGRLVVVSFHSLEDRIVKRFLTGKSTHAARPSRHMPAAPLPRPLFTLLPARTPGDAEVAANPRARSARLRAGVRLAA